MDTEHEAILAALQYVFPPSTSRWRPPSPPPQPALEPESAHLGNPPTPTSCAPPLPPHERPRPTALLWDITARQATRDLYLPIDMKEAEVAGTHRMPTLTDSGGDNSQAPELALSPAGTMLAAVDSNGRVYLWRIP